MKNQRCPIIRIKKNGTEIDKVSVPIGRTGLLNVQDIQDQADELLTDLVDEGVDTKISRWETNSGLLVCAKIMMYIKVVEHYTVFSSHDTYSAVIEYPVD